MHASLPFTRPEVWVQDPGPRPEQAAVFVPPGAFSSYWGGKRATWCLGTTSVPPCKGREREHLQAVPLLNPGDSWSCGFSTPKSEGWIPQLRSACFAAYVSVFKGMGRRWQAAACPTHNQLNLGKQVRARRGQGAASHMAGQGKRGYTGDPESRGTKPWLS